MLKIVSLVGFLPFLLSAAAPVAAATVAGTSRANCAYAITKLQAQIKYETGVKNTAGASAAVTSALALDAKTVAFKGMGASADAAQSDAACHAAVIKGWTSLQG
jgi:hypothetical protein